MAFTCGFFNSQNGDRKYNAEQMASIFDGLIKDGVYDTIGDIFAVTPGTGMQVLVGSGRAWFDHTWNNNDASYPLAITAADVSLPRYDAVVLETNHSDTVRTNRLRVVTGTPASNPAKPTMTSTENVKQHPLAYIKVTAGATAITQSMIEVVVGTSECPFVTGIIETAQIDALFQQWNGEFDEWFENLKAQLSDNVVANLQNQIDQKVAKADVATTADIEAGTSTTKWVTPKGLKEAGVGGIKTDAGIYTINDIGFKESILNVNSYTSSSAYYYAINGMGLDAQSCARLGDDFFIKIYYTISGNACFIDVHNAITGEVVIQKHVNVSANSANVYIPQYLHVGDHMDFFGLFIPTAANGNNHNIFFICPKEKWSLESTVNLSNDYRPILAFESESYFGAIAESSSYTPYQYKAIVKNKISKETVYNNTIRFAGSSNSGNCNFLGIYGDSLYISCAETNAFVIRKWNMTSNSTSIVCSIPFNESINSYYRFFLYQYVSSSEKDKKAYILPRYYDGNYTYFANQLLIFDYTSETCNIASLGASDFTVQTNALVRYDINYIGSNSLYHYAINNNNLVRVLRNTNTIEVISNDIWTYIPYGCILEEVCYKDELGIYGRYLIDFNTLTTKSVIVQLNTGMYYNTSGVTNPDKLGIAVYAISPIPRTVPIGSINPRKNLLFAYQPHIGISPTQDTIRYPTFIKESD